MSSLDARIELVAEQPSLARTARERSPSASPASIGEEVAHRDEWCDVTVQRLPRRWRCCGLRWAYLAAADATAMEAEEAGTAACGCWSKRPRSARRHGPRSCRRSPPGRGIPRTRITVPRAWLIHKTGVTKAAAVSATPRGRGRGGRSIRRSSPHWPRGSCRSRWGQDDLHLDRQASRGLPGEDGRRDLDQRRAGGDGPAGPGRAATAQVTPRPARSGPRAGVRGPRRAAG